MMAVKKVKRLYPGFKPEHYELYLEPDRDQAVFSGRVVIDGVKTGRPSKRISLHQKGLKITKASLTKQDKTGQAKIPIVRVNTHKSFDELRLHTASTLHSGSYRLEIEFLGQITEPMHGIYPCNFKLNGQPKQLIATQLESHHAREVFPCIDEPEAKASFSLSLATPATETVVANTPIISQQTKAGKLITKFQPTPKMSTYLLAFVYGELASKSAKSASGVEIRTYATPDKLELTDFALSVAVRCLEFFEDYYGVAYPLPKLDLIGLPDFSAGAMENWGLITFREQIYYVDPQASSIETKQSVATVICHEIAHQWFGNLVTMKWWSDLWLNESFANLMEYQAVDALFPDWNIWQEFVQRETTMALSRDALPNVQPVQVSVNHPDELTSVFDPAIVYAKGGNLLNMVRWLIGDDSFRQGLNSYFKQYEYQNTEAGDLWRHLEAASHLPISQIMTNWLEKPGYPVITVQHQPTSHQYTVSQQRLVFGQTKDSPTWSVPLAASTSKQNQLLKTKSDSFSINAQTDYPLTLNHDGHSYFVTHYQAKDHQELLLKSVEKGILSPIDRLLLVQNHLLLERAGLVSTLENLKLLDPYKNDRDEAVWSMLAGIIGNARNLIDKDQALEERLNAYLRPIIEPLVSSVGWRGSKTDSSQTQKLRALALSLAATAQDQTVIKEGLKRFKDFSRPADLSADIRGVVYYIAVRYGQNSDFVKLLKLYNSLNNADEKEEIAVELTASRDPDKTNKLLDMLKTDVRLQDAPAWFAWLMRNRYARDLTWAWLQTNWQWIEQKFGGDKSYDLFPRYSAAAFSFPTQLKEYIAFFEPKKNLALERSIELGLEEIKARIDWRQGNEAAIKQWLKTQPN